MSNSVIISESPKRRVNSTKKNMLTEQNSYVNINKLSPRQAMTTKTKCSLKTEQCKMNKRQMLGVSLKHHNVLKRKLRNTKQVTLRAIKAP